MPEVTPHFDVAEEAKARALRDPLERARNGLDLRMIGRHAEADEPPRRRQPVEHVHLDARILAREQRSRRIEPRRAGPDDRDAKGVLGGHAARIMADGCSHRESSSEPRRSRLRRAAATAAAAALIRAASRNGRAVKRLLTVGLAVAGGALAAVALAWLGWAWYESRLPATYSVMDYAIPDGGGAPVDASHAGHAHGTTSVVDLRGPRGTPQRRFTLTAQRGTVRLASGRTVEALTFNGTVPGPELRVREGELVEVTLLNRDVAGGVSVHWHGVDVPNGEDGVAGVTQDAVPPGGSHVYRFRAGQVGTFWYHAHQASATEVRRGLYGALVIQPQVGAAPGCRGHRGRSTHARRHAARERDRRSGTPRGRTGDPGSAPADQHRQHTAHGSTSAGRGSASSRSTARISSAPRFSTGRTLELAAGGRYDVAFAMPRTPVKLAVEETVVGLALSADGTADPPAPPPGPEFDPAAYGRPAPTPFGATSHFDRVFTLEVGRKPGFLDGRPGLQWTINGGIYPRVPMFVVARGDLVRISIRNTTGAVHPMHLHGHHMLVLSRDGVPSPAARGGATRSTSIRASATRSPSAPTTPASGWTTATTCSTRPTASRCTSPTSASRHRSKRAEPRTTTPNRDVRGRRHAVSLSAGSVRARLASGRRGLGGCRGRPPSLCPARCRARSTGAG